MHPDHMIGAGQMMFLDCPAYLDEDGAQRCGLPAEVRCRFIMRSSDGPFEAVMIRCPSGHWFNGPIESLTWEAERDTTPANAGTASSAAYPRLDGLDDGGLGRPTDNSPRVGAAIIARPNSAPAYYLGRPARIWITAMSSRCSRRTAADAQNPTGQDHRPNPAHEPSQAAA